MLLSARDAWVFLKWTVKASPLLLHTAVGKRCAVESALGEDQTHYSLATTILSGWRNDWWYKKKGHENRMNRVLCQDWLWLLLLVCLCQVWTARAQPAAFHSSQCSSQTELSLPPALPFSATVQWRHYSECPDVLAECLVCRHKVYPRRIHGSWDTGCALQLAVLPCIARMTEWEKGH